jgi:hypothetical protein
MTIRTSILVDQGKKDKLIELGFNISSVCRAAIDQALDVSNDDLIFDMRIRRIEDEIVVQSGREQDLTVALDYCRSRLKYLKEERERLVADSVKAIAISQYSAVITKINRIIIAAHYERNSIDMALETVTGKEIMKEVLRLNPAFDLSRQIINIQSVMES